MSDFEMLRASNNPALSEANCSIVKFFEPEVVLPTQRLSKTIVLIIDHCKSNSNN